MYERVYADRGGDSESVDEVSTAAGNIVEAGRLADFIAGTLPSLSHVERQSVLEQNDARSRLQFINQQLAREVELLELRRRFSRRCRVSSHRASGSSTCANS